MEITMRQDASLLSLVAEIKASSPNPALKAAKCTMSDSEAVGIIHQDYVPLVCFRLKQSLYLLSSHKGLKDDVA